MNILYLHTLINLPTLISFLAFLMLGAYVFIKNRHQHLNLLFALGMGSLALMEFGNFMTLISMGSHATIFWKRISLVGECLVPITWLVFSIFLVNYDPWSQLKKKKTLIIAIGVISVFFLVSVPTRLFLISDESSNILHLQGIGKGFYIFFLLILVALIATLENTIRQAKGEERIKIKYLLLGLGGIYGFLIFLTSHILLFSHINLIMIPMASSFFFICTCMIAFAIIRYRLMNINLYLSRSVIYNSLTLFLIGGYLIFIGLVSQALRYFHIMPGYPFEMLFYFMAILLFFSLFLSNQFRWKAKMFINRHFYRSRYDYRDEWLKFAEGLSLKLDMDDLVTTIVNMLKDSIGVREVSLWLHEKNNGDFLPLSPSSITSKARLKMDQKFLSVLIEKKEPILVDMVQIRAYIFGNSEILERIQPGLLVPLVSGKEMVGMIFLGKKVTGEGFLGDDICLLRSAAAQITGALMNTKLSQELIEAKEMEMFHHFSSFVIHDLKNLISSLSLILQNAGEHMCNPRFQKDTLETIERSVKKMDLLITRLSKNNLPEGPNLEETNINELITEVINRTYQNGPNGKTVKLDLRNTPKIFIDRDQIEKVIKNLLFNAIEAAKNGGLVKIKTEANSEKMILSVSDDGHGMSQEFMENMLFRPFKSTKKKGLGIGLYQCKTIIEAHQGKIEVESKKGAGSTFRIIMPCNGQKKENAIQGSKDFCTDEFILHNNSNL